MNKLILSFVIISSIFVFTKTQATVGGETVIYNFKYNPIDESVYYIKQSYSGRGCPPELIKLSLNTGKDEVVYSCDEAEKLSTESDWPSFSGANFEINKIIDGFKSLTAIDLKKNNISIDVNFTKAEIFEDNPEYIIRREFIANIYQNNKKISEFKIAGCNLEQPFTFQGYAIPGFEKKIILLLSTKGDCFEGGYVYETLHIAGGIENLDKSSIGNFYKSTSLLVPNEGNLVVFKSDIIPTKANQVDVKNNLSFNIFAGVLLVLIGIILGRFFPKK